MPRREDGLAPDTMLAGLAAAKAAKLAEINVAFDVVAAALTATYPDKEVLTFDQQVEEARAFLADASAACPMLQPLAAARGIELADLCERVLAKHDLFSAATGALMGRRQALEDRLDACETVKDVMAITVDFNLSPAA